MGRQKLLFVLLLMLTLYVDSKASLIHLEKTTGREPNVTPICSSSNMSIISLIICKVRMEMSPGEECQLLYRLGHDFEHKCNPRVRLKKENETMFLDLTSLTPMDSGIYTCECSLPGATKIIHLNITVKGDEATSGVTEISSVKLLVIGVIIIIIISGVILGFLYRMIHHGNRRQQDLPPSPPVTELIEDIEPYSTFVQRENVLYSVLKMPSRKNQKEPVN
nr:uncharacterized protein LOC110001002 [Labrus bergylta]